MTKIKLCGLSRPCDIDCANALSPDYIGFVFAEKSRRYVSPDTARALRARLDPAIQVVAVTVDLPPADAAALVHSGAADILQLHGQEDEAYLRELRALVHCPVIQAFRIDTAADTARAAASTADFVLLDSGAGGTGVPFDWTAAHPLDRPFFLAGGLDVQNVGEAVRRFHPYAVDVSSGVETAGVKDFDKMQRFVAAVRAQAAEK